MEILPIEFVEDRENVGGRDHDDVRLEVGDQASLPLRHPPGNRDYGAAEALGAVVRAETAREKAVAVGNVNTITGSAARRSNRPSDDVRPGVEVTLRIADD